jgi:hypothetical protein
MSTSFVSVHSMYFAADGQVDSETFVVLTEKEKGLKTVLKEYDAKTVTRKNGVMKCSCGVLDCDHIGKVWLFLLKKDFAITVELSPVTWL